MATVKTSQKARPSASSLAALYSDILPQAPSRAQSRTLEIIEGAIHCYATLGIDGTTYENIAKASKISRPLIFRYFKDREAIFESAIRYIRTHFQKLAVDAIMAETEPKMQLEAYVLSTFAWVAQYPEHVRTWILFYYSCGTNAKHRALNTDLVKMGHERITAILAEGKKRGDFNCAKPSQSARAIQMLITGALISAATEDPFIPIKELKAITTQEALRMAGATG